MGWPARRSIGVTTALLAALIVAATPSSGGTPTQRDAAPAFLGFEIGDEIRYALELEGNAGLAIVAQWTLRLDAVDTDAGLGVFDLSYLGGRPGRTIATQVELTAATNTTARAWINAHGFPVRLRFATQRNTAAGDIEYAIEYRHDSDRYRKELEAQGFRDGQDVDLDEIAGIDLRVPDGLYLFAPVEAACLLPPPATAVGGPGAGAGQPTGGGISAASDGADPAPVCKGRELAFANPGLLNLTMPELWETGTGSLSFAVLAPTGVLESVITDASGGRGGAGNTFSISGIPLSALFGGPDLFGPAEDALTRVRLQSEGDLLELEVGGRIVDAWKMAASPPLESVYVDGNGSIVRLDLPADPQTGERLRIRRLRPSEY